MALRLNSSYASHSVREHELGEIWNQVETAHTMLHEKTGAGSNFLGWVDHPLHYDTEEYERIKRAANTIRNSCDVLLVIGIGGSYLGARAAIELLQSPFYNSLSKDTPEIYFVGNNISGSYLNEVLTLCEGKDICINMISKSGTTTEPALAFRVFQKMVVEKYGAEQAKDRIFCTTDKERGTLKELADKEGYETFVIPDDIGGRYSVLTAVGLLPIAAAGCDIDAIMQGAKDAHQAYREPTMDNDCYRYAALRNILYRKGYSTEVFVAYEPGFALMAEWFKQLFGESEGKDGKGLYPASMIFSTDLHSLGQFVQDGSQILFETVLHVKNPKQDFFIEKTADDLDGLNFLADQNMSTINEKAMQGTMLAHVEGGVPNLLLELENMGEYSFGYLAYFFMKACGISGYMLGVNPFNQPGVEDYKKNMFALLGKPGFEDRKAELEAKL